jgi:hypothetical protein
MFGLHRISSQSAPDCPSGFLAAHVAAELAVKLETAGTVEP